MSDRFYQTGGALPISAASYILRQADEELYTSLKARDYCYILTSRQMGKSSMMVRTANRLRSEDITVAMLDLSGRGQNLTPVQWYDGIVASLGSQLNLEEQLDEFWFSRDRSGPLQRTLDAFEKLILPGCPGPLVVFVDEIDAVRSLPFPTDEFFHGIRECYNRRPHSPQFQKLTFCLIGVAAPSDLIQDVRTTPFNIGRRIALTDFTPEECQPLAAGLGRAEAWNEAAIRQIIRWAHGHPYLTQRLCEEVATCKENQPPAQIVDQVCERLFLTPAASEQDNNLIFVRERLIRSEVDVGGLLDLYRQIWRRPGRLANDARDPLISILRLSGIVRMQKDRLYVRNAIYRRAFNQDWVRRNLPNAELERQRSAFHRGMVRAASIAGVVLAVMGVLTTIALRNGWRADERALAAQRYLYVADMSLAQQAMDSGALGRAAKILSRLAPEPGQPDLRGFEWRYAWRRCWTTPGLVGHIPDPRLKWAAVGPGHRWMAAVGQAGLTLISLQTGSIRHIALQPARATSIAFSSNNRWLAVGGLSSIAVYALSTGALLFERSEPGTVVQTAFSPDDRLLALCDARGGVQVLAIPIGHNVLTIPPDGNMESQIAFSSDGRWLYHANRSQVRAVSTGSWATAAHCSVPHGCIGPVLVSSVGVAITRTRSSALMARHIRASSPWAPLVPSAEESPQIAMSPSKDRILVLAGARAMLCDLNTERITATYPAPVDAMMPQFEDDHTWSAVTAQRDLDWMDVASGRTLRKTHMPEGSTYISDGICYVPVAGGADGYDVLDARPRGSPWTHAAGANLATVSNDYRGGPAAAIDTPRGALVWNVDLQSTAIQTAGRPVVTAVSPAGRLAVCLKSGEIEVFDLAKRRPVWVTRVPGVPIALAISTDGRTLAAAGADGRLRVWRIGTARPIASLAPFRGGLQILCFSPGADRIALGSSASDTGLLWDPERNRTTASLGSYLGRPSHPTFPGPSEDSGHVTAYAFSMDGRLVAQASSSGRIDIYLTADGKRVAPGIESTFGITALTFSPDGRTLASGSEDATIRFWNTGTGQNVGWAAPGCGPIQGLAFSTDGRALLAVDSAGEAWRLDGSEPEVLSEARSFASGSS